MSKTLYVVVTNGGDGSSYPNYTFNTKFIEDLKLLCDDGLLGYDEGYGDGDGFHYETLQVPDECTPESMGFSDFAYDLSEHFEKEEEE